MLFGFTDGRRKNIRTAQTNPNDPTVQNGTPNPPILYSADPMAGPEISKAFFMKSVLWGNKDHDLPRV